MKFSQGMLLLLAMALVQPVVAAEKKARPQTATQVRHEDGRVVERLVLPPSRNDTPGEQPVAAEIWARRSLDPAWMAELAKNPKLFSQYLDALTEPRFMTALATLSTQGQAHTQSVDPELLQRLVRESSPDSVRNWAAAGMDPRFYWALFSQMANPEKAMRWANCQWPMDLAKVGSGQALSPLTTPDGVMGGWLKLPLPAGATARSTAY